MASEPSAKQCTGCKRDLPVEAFARDRNRRDGLQVRCRECVAEYSAAHCRRRREAIGKQGRQDHLKRQYGITEVERDELIAFQAGVCCICLAAPAAHVDHCHETGRVRGVLCFSCNAALGQFKDRPDVIRRAAAYVEGNAWKPTLVAPGVYQLPS
ncbi:endonuclease VII domain-containing protein [Streptomyces sp. TRM72054]|uniref:endonuclease VII domain-containing protein n=1 Tax=Streptomyces sp. TRM72054 TaxID=2870562 RepID=UPI001C8B7BF2|nr:endonuclease VII domain-containing protein [Streptomyces sp. TRM72054]MBX9395871.1 endonuclease VII domain-containing protein [Streptomyces sp. TRM72054]